MNEMIKPPQNAVSPEELRRAFREDPGVLLLDVRSPQEFSEGHIPGARLVPLGDLAPRQWLQEHADRCSRLIVICQSGARARKAIEAFKKSGFDRCCLLEGGMDAWLRAGLPFEGGKSSGISILRQVQLIIGSATALFAALALAIDSRFAIIPLISGAGLVFAGASGRCGLALILAKMPWNRSQPCSPNLCCDQVQKGTP
jgi:rhodanese-related sulfurtransferase